MIATCWKTRWNRRQIGLSANLQDQVHSYDNVIQEMAMEQPRSYKKEKILFTEYKLNIIIESTRVVGPEPQYNVTIVRYSNSVLHRGQIVLTM